jgi:hypothetical protein
VAGRDLGARARAVLSHRSAGALWGLLSADDAPLEVTVPTGRAARSGIVVHRASCSGHEQTCATGSP